MSADLAGEFSQSSGRSPGLTLELSSNNPFRNRAASPNGPSPGLSPHPHSPFDDPPARPVSRNPFIDPLNKPQATQAQREKSPESMSSRQDTRSPTAEELFDNLKIDGSAPKPKPPPPGRPDGPRGPMRRPSAGPPRGDIPPRGRAPPPSSSHRPSRSQEEAMRARRMQGGSRPSNGKLLDISPEKRSDRRPRRNSESSVRSHEKPLTEEGRKEREMRRRDRERRHRDMKEKDPKTGHKGKRLDLIDQLDATSIYGTGLFHHDGPFDALNPHRNRKGSRRAPMQAFPEGSLNNSLGGSGPLQTRPDHATFMGKHDDEAFLDYNVGAKEEPRPQRREQPLVFDPLSRGSVLHGDDSIGLGTSTFLEGTPAARADVQRAAQDTMEQGLQRKKSLAQRIRGINRGPREYGSGRMTNPEGMYSPRCGDLPSANSTGERNPFFSEYGGKDEERITVKRTDTGHMPPMSPESPGAGTGPGSLERRATTDSSSGAKSQSNGLLARVKSLKGGPRRQRPERPEQGPPSYAPPAASDNAA